MKMDIGNWNKQRQRRKAQRRRAARERIARYGRDILRSENFRATRENIQHGTVSVHRHSISVAQCSLEIAEKLEALGIRSRERDMVRGALLHDYFLYDWHKHKSSRWWKMHGFCHPGVALRNAGQEYELTDRQKDIIRKHMWPLTVTPPRCREAWIVTAADKYCSLLETLRLRNERRRGRRERRGRDDMEGMHSAACGEK